MRSLPVLLAGLLAACVQPVGDPRPWGQVIVDGETYAIDAQQHIQSDTGGLGPGGAVGAFDLYFVTVNGRRVECGTRAGANRATVLERCEARVRALLAPPPDRDDDDDGGYRPPD